VVGQKAGRGPGAAQAGSGLCSLGWHKAAAERAGAHTCDARRVGRPTPRAGRASNGRRAWRGGGGGSAPAARVCVCRGCVARLSAGGALRGMASTSQCGHLAWLCRPRRADQACSRRGSTPDVVLPAAAGRDGARYDKPGAPPACMGTARHHARAALLLSHSRPERSRVLGGGRANYIQTYATSPAAAFGPLWLQPEQVVGVVACSASLRSRGARACVDFGAPARGTRLNPERTDDSCASYGSSITGPQRRRVARPLCERQEVAFAERPHAAWYLPAQRRPLTLPRRAGITHARARAVRSLC
jgi:hypothetical protein